MLISIFFYLVTVSESGGKRTRTADFLRARQALYQLSYTPTLVSSDLDFMSPELILDYPLLITDNSSLFSRWAILDLNQGPHPYQGCALTN